MYVGPEEDGRTEDETGCKPEPRSEEGEQEDQFTQLINVGQNFCYLITMLNSENITIYFSVDNRILLNLLLSIKNVLPHL